MLETIVDAVGPFLVPVVLFCVGAIGYLLLLALSRRGVLGGD
jgi:hypothetical protein